jgi:CheY-like chemotaxis protein
MKKIKILIAEDNDLHRENLTELLSEKGILFKFHGETDFCPKALQFFRLNGIILFKFQGKF